MYILFFSCSVKSNSLKTMDYSMPSFRSFTLSWSLLKLMSIELVMLSNHLILCHLLLLLTSIFPSIRVFSNELTLHIRLQKNWSFGFSLSPSNEVDFFRTDWFDSLQSKGLSRVFSNITVQKYQFFSAQTSFMVQLSHPYMTTGKTKALTRRSSVSKVTSLFFNMLSRFVIAFLPRSAI